VKVPRDVNGAEAVRALKPFGFIQLRQTGSHPIPRKENRTVVVPQHNPLKPKSIIKQAGLTLEQIVAEL
jgi:predicted RNA binding protein YcfA (HicA-like mRNA interferase family)